MGNLFWKTRVFLLFFYFTGLRFLHTSTRLSKKALHLLLIATRNRNKLREISELLGSDFELLGMDSLSKVPDIEESGDTFEANARLKAEFISEFFSDWVLADDSGLEVDALGGAPGVFSARFAGKGATDAENRALLLRRLDEKGVQRRQRTARFRCVLALAKAGKTILTVSGTVEGTIAEAERGRDGFGYDSLFVPVGYSNSFCELSLKIKNKISHRGRALQELRRIWVTKCVDL